MAQIYGLGINLFNYLHILTICIFRVKISKRKKNPIFIIGEEENMEIGKMPILPQLL